MTGSLARCITPAIMSPANFPTPFRPFTGRCLFGVRFPFVWRRSLAILRYSLRTSCSRIPSVVRDDYGVASNEFRKFDPDVLGIRVPRVIHQLLNRLFAGPIAGPEKRRESRIDLEFCRASHSSPYSIIHPDRYEHSVSDVLIAGFPPCRRRRGFRFAHFHKQTAAYYWIFVQEHIGLYAPGMPTLRPRNAEKPSKKRPFFTEENSVLHRHHRRSAPRMPNGFARIFRPADLGPGMRPQNAEVGAFATASAPRMPNAD